MAEKAKKKGLLSEFKEFITRGNVVDLAVGVIIGGAFTAIVTALTKQILEPFINYLISLAMGGVSLESARTILGNPMYTTEEVGGTTIQTIDWTKTNYIDWGAFLSAIINFFLVALILFIIVKALNSVRIAGEKAKEAAKARCCECEEEKKAE